MRAAWEVILTTLNFDTVVLVLLIALDGALLRLSISLISAIIVCITTASIIKGRSCSLK